MTRRLAAWVYVHRPDTGETVGFGPDDDVPGWAADLITNPAAWGAGSRWSIPAPLDPGPTDPRLTMRRPKGNASREEWADYADALGVSYAQGATRNQIRDAMGAE